MTTKRPYEDGVHYVTPAPDTDRHPLRWLVKSVRQSTVKTNRRAETKEEAARLAFHLSKNLILESKTDQALFAAYEAKITVRSDKKVKKAKAQYQRKERLELEKFATTHFNCIRANPIAQVWQCVSMVGTHKPIGRRKQNGRPPTQAPVRHALGECAVLLGREPHRDKEGRVTVFANWQQAEQAALDLYYGAHEEDRIFWQEPEGRVVGRTVEIEIMFDPAVNGAARPFNLWFHKHGKPYYRHSRSKNLITPAKDAAGRSYQPQDTDDRAAHDFNRRIERMAQDDHRTLSMEVAKYRTIWEAEAEAIRLEREYFGNGKYYP